MPEFTSPTDIGNRALQLCGAEMMDPVAGFTENSKVARQVSFVYGKLRQAELRRNTWRFATRKTAIRPIDSNTMLLAPSLWSSSVTYFVDSIVSDASGTLWISTAPNNLNNNPQNSTLWDPYFGPMTVGLYDSSQAYFAGEIVYTMAGDGTYNVWKSKISQNAIHPALPNQWLNSTVYFQNQVVQVFAAWASGTTYTAGTTVTYTDGNTYTSLVSSNIGNAPTSFIGTKWALTPTLVLISQTVPITTLVSPPATSPVNEWQIGTTYSLGVFVMFNGLEYVSIANNNTGNLPNAAGSTNWAALSGGTLYMSLIDLNMDNNPTSSPALWASGTTYSSGQQVYSALTGLIYTSAVNGNLGNDPSQDNGTHWTNTGVLCPWATSFVQGGGNSQWIQVGGASFPNGVGLSEVNINWPVGSGPLWQSYTKNVYRLPAGYLHRAPQDPAAGSFSWLGSPTNLQSRDWSYERNLLVTSDSIAIVFRFVADIQDVTQFDPMFCEGLAARIAEQVCEPLTQSTAKLAAIAGMYKHVMGEARLANGIETGPEEPELDDFIACRQ